MRIGQIELNQNESQWCQKYAEDILTQAKNQIVAALNKKVSTDDVAGLLKYIWNNPTKASNDEAEAADIEDAYAESGEDDE